MPYDIQKRIKQVIAFDDIRKLKILEMFQYNFIGFIIVTILGYVFNKFLFKKTLDYFTMKHKTNNVTDKTYSGFFTLCAVTLIETFVILVILFYIRKILLIFPPIGERINKKFVGLTTVNDVIGLTMYFLFLEFVSGYREKTSLILNYEFDDEI